MKVSLVTSGILHASLLAFALLTIGAPQPLDVGDVEALPVDLVPIEEMTQIQQGDKKAPLAEKSAPVPTTRPNVVANAENIGNNDIDLKAPPTPAAKPSNNETAAAPAKTETPKPVNDTVTNDVKEIVKEETAAPAEKPAIPEKKPEPTPVAKPVEPTPAEEKPVEKAAEQVPLPDSIPLPAAKPKPVEQPKQAEAKPVEKPAEKKPEETRAAEKPSDKKPGEKKQEMAKSASSKESDFNADDVAALLNKQAPSGGGARRSTDQAALGGKKTTGGSKLSQTEMDALRGQIQNNWSIISGIEGADGVIVTVTMKLDQSGGIIGRPEVTAKGGSETARRTLEGSALRAVMRSAPFQNLPADKYDAWSEVIVNFDPSELL